LIDRGKFSGQIAPVRIRLSVIELSGKTNGTRIGEAAVALIRKSLQNNSLLDAKRTGSNTNGESTNGGPKGIKGKYFTHSWNLTGIFADGWHPEARLARS